jgi:hypothetical protein
MLRVVLERAVGDLTLPASVRIVAAANPPEQAADGWDLPAPLANRLIHLDWTVSAASVADGFTGGFSTPSLEGYGVCADVDRTRALVGAFLRVRPEPVLNVPDGPARAWPSPRTWEPAAIALAHTIKAPDEVRAELVTGAVGEAAGYELLSWLRDLKFARPGDPARRPRDAPLPSRVDRVHAVLGSVVAHVAARRHLAGERPHRVPWPVPPGHAADGGARRRAQSTVIVHHRPALKGRRGRPAGDPRMGRRHDTIAGSDHKVS